MYRQPLAIALFLASASAALAQELSRNASNGLVAPAAVALYIHSEMDNTDFVRPLVCALENVLIAPVSMQKLNLPLGREFLASPTQLNVGKVLDKFVQSTATDGDPRAFKYLLLPYDLKDLKLRYVFATSLGNETTQHHVGVVSTARLRANSSIPDTQQDGNITATRTYKLILKSIARIAGLKSPDACVLAFPRSLDELDRKSTEFCPDDRAKLIAAGILKSKEGLGPNCLLISQLESPGVDLSMTGIIADGMAQMSEKFVKMGGQVYVEAEAVKESNKAF